MTWFHSAAVQFPRERHLSKRKHRSVGVMDSTRNGHRDSKCPSAFVWFEMTQRPLVKLKNLSLRYCELIHNRLCLRFGSCSVDICF
ncbi:hypothetical protein TNCV_1305991 [Trichonephila clavipes]|nr:hypothetical protein TNCV_1305991 [Trichonephila clavipes]